MKFTLNIRAVRSRCDAWRARHTLQSAGWTMLPMSAQTLALWDHKRWLPRVCVQFRVAARGYWHAHGTRGCSSPPCGHATLAGRDMRQYQTTRKCFGRLSRPGGRTTKLVTAQQLEPPPTGLHCVLIARSAADVRKLLGNDRPRSKLLPGTAVLQRLHLPQNHQSMAILRLNV